MITERVMGDWGLPLVLSSLLSLPATSTACKTLERAGCVTACRVYRTRLQKGWGWTVVQFFYRDCITMPLFYVLLWLYICPVLTAVDYKNALDEDTATYILIAIAAVFFTITLLVIAVMI